ncbi:hypothetical protein ACIPDS_11385 [Kluyvera sp. NPDC087067]|uniref:hypothetical protein n=1 Tax=Kluyvera sp. NPDC087067 TaxID=3364105 RepID=UPI003826F869
MKIVSIMCITAIGLMLSTVAQAKTQSNSGTIHFVGEIVEGACSATIQRSQLQFSCYRNGSQSTQRVTVNPDSAEFSLQNIAKVSQRSLPGHPELQEVTISYL